MKYIISTMANAVAYTIYNKNAELPVLQKTITIKGGANMASMTSGFGELSHTGEGQPLWTPSGMVTEVSDEDYAILVEHPVFKRHLEQGYVIDSSMDVRGSLKALNKVTKGMAEDGRAQLDKDSIKTRVPGARVNVVVPNAKVQRL